MRYALQSLLIICGGVGALFVLNAAMDMRSAIQEIEVQIGVLTVAVCAGALLIGGGKPAQQSSSYVPPFPPPPGQQ
jgi:hypothetical protein